MATTFELYRQDGQCGLASYMPAPDRCTRCGRVLTLARVGKSMCGDRESGSADTLYRCESCGALMTSRAQWACPIIPGSSE